jgi:hypothetical protein
MLYAISTLHCMTVSLSSGGAGLGTRRDPMNLIYISRRRD